MLGTKMNWSDPNCDFLPITFGLDHFNLVVMTKSLWSGPNQFGQTKTIFREEYLIRRPTYINEFF